MKKKISIITSGHPYYDERIFYKFARSLNKNGYEVSIICSTVESEMDSVKDNIRIIGFNGSNLKKFVKLNKFEECLRNIKPDVIICCEPLPILAANKIRKENKFVKIIYDVTEWYPHQNMLKYRRGIKWFASYAYFFLFNIYAASLCNHLIIGEKRKAISYKIFLPFHKRTIIDYYSSYRHFNYSPLKFDGKTFTICFVGKISEERGIFSFLGVLNSLNTLYPNLEICAKIIGDFDNEITKNKVDEFIRANGELITEFTGWIPYENLSDSLENVHLCLDLREKNFVYNHSFPIKIFEFMACGKPVIYSDVQPLKEFVDLNKFGFLVNPKNIGTICQKISLYIEDSSLLKEHSKNARSLFEKKYNWEKIEPLLIFVVNDN
jgi:glycosyltransferase involved in cell wall biosynthesis